MGLWDALSVESSTCLLLGVRVVGPGSTGLMLLNWRRVQQDLRLRRRDK